MKKSFFLISLFPLVIILPLKSFCQPGKFIPLTGDFSFIPDFEKNNTLLMVNVHTEIRTNVNNVPLSYDTDSLFLKLEISKLNDDSNGWHINLTHFKEPDLKKEKGVPSQFNRMYPIEILFDSNFQYIGVPNWEWWKNQYLINLAYEGSIGKIDSATYQKFYFLYSDRNYLEKSLLGSYLDFFEIFGRTIILWNEYPVMRNIEIPYNFEIIEKTGFEKAYNPEQDLSYVYHYSITKTDEAEYQVLAEALVNNLQGLTPEQKANYPLPKIFIKETTFHSFDIKRKLFSEFRFEKEVNVNGTKTLFEDYLKLILIKN